jgi:large subunit ribosomal protein L36e
VKNIPVEYDQVAGSPMDKQSIAVGKGKGFPVTERAKKQKPSHRKGGVENKVVRRKVHFVRELIREVMGLAPYEKRVIGSFHSSILYSFFFAIIHVLVFHNFLPLFRVVEARQGEACSEGC